MKILVIDRDSLSTQLLKPRLEAKGHVIIEEPVKNNALAMLEKENFDTVLFDRCAQLPLRCHDVTGYRSRAGFEIRGKRSHS